MPRNFSCRGLVLRVRPVGESNREVTFLTAEEGLVRATVFGGPKSALRAQAAPYHEGSVWFYRDPVKNYIKVTDFDVQNWRPGLRESYQRSISASAVAETLILSDGGGGPWAEALKLAADTLDALESADDNTGRRITIRFLWNWMEVMGCRPEPGHCASCGKEAGQGETFWYSLREEQFFCAPCTGIAPDDAAPGLVPDRAAAFLPLHAGTRRWFLASASPADSARLGLDRPLEKEARAIAAAILETALGRRLSTRDW